MPNRKEAMDVHFWRESGSPSKVWQEAPSVHVYLIIKGSLGEKLPSYGDLKMRRIQ